MKTPDYSKRAGKNYRKRLKQKGYKYYCVLTTPEIVERLKEFYQSIKE